ncbi:hypothetical protein [Sanguibacter antarcticus]|uniref:Uncharacterized protein n=1 Tax=Sanguibacter antarcticus TaxID=372484 RepID=A0A2A9E3E2_9MICO|nr:hypothetical protein [Sanguibacter antarcticus]PFG33166.1 hypothetical protein ATL42_1026 [Sanguibacter antarcticus]
MLSISILVSVVVCFWWAVDLVTRDWSSRRSTRLRAGISRPFLPRSMHQRLFAPGDPDPFVALRLQLRLAAITREIQSLERGAHEIAVAHHLRASQYAYDALLSEACRLAGLDAAEPVPPPNDDARPQPGALPAPWSVDEEHRMHQELELGARGWSW